MQLDRQRVGWFRQFEVDPEGALDDLLRGIAEVAPYERAEAVDVLLLFFPSESAPLWRELDLALRGWLRRRRKDGPHHRSVYGINRYCDELVQGLRSIYRLSLKAAATELRLKLQSYQMWLSPLYSGPGRDPEGEFWRALALTQDDRMLIGKWYFLCAEAGTSLPEHYADIGVLGLRHLPTKQGEAPGTLETEVLGGLFQWAAHLADGPANRKAFQRRLSSLMVLYPRSPQRWRELIFPVLMGQPDAPFRNWLRDAGIDLRGLGLSPRRVSAELPPKHRLDSLLRRFREEPSQRLLPDIRALVEDYERYAEATGNSEFVVKTAMHFSGKLLQHEPAEALRLARLGNRWQPSNPYTWSQFAAALVRLGEHERAETVLWEAMRRFPADLVARNSLANLLAQLQRHDEAEALLREGLKRAPDDGVTRNSLGNLLAQTQRYDEAESLFREELRRDPDDGVARNSLANLLAQTQRYDEAESLLREEIARHPGDKMAATSLANVLTSIGRHDEAEKILRQELERHPDDHVVRHALIRLLAKMSRHHEADELRREESAQQPLSSDSQHSENFSLDQLDRTGEQEALTPEGGKLGRPIPLDRRDSLAEEENSPGQKQPSPATDSSSFENLGESRRHRVGHEDQTEKEPSDARRSGIESDGDADPAGQDADRHEGVESFPYSRTSTTGIPRVDRHRDSGGGGDALELPSNLIRNSRVSRADFKIRTGMNGEVRRKSLTEIEKILAEDSEQVYPRVVLALHDEVRRMQLPELANAFPHAYPLRFLAAREASTPQLWNRLLSDFGREKYALTLLGRVTASNGSADPNDAARLWRWAEEAKETRTRLESFTAERLRRWCGQDDGGDDPAEILHCLRRHREDIEVFLGDALRQTADESVSHTG